MNVPSAYIAVVCNNHVISRRDKSESKYNVSPVAITTLFPGIINRCLKFFLQLLQKRITLAF